MKRTFASLLLLSILALFVYAVLIYQPSRAQTSSAPPASQPDGLKQIPKLVRDVKATGAAFAQRDLIQTEDRLFQANSRLVQNQEQMATVLDDGVLFDLDKTAVPGLLKDSVDFLTLSLPDGQGARVELELVKVDIFAPGFSVKTAAPTSEQLDGNRGVHYRGIVKGNDQSLAAISIFENEVIGFFSTPTDGNSVIGKLAGDNPSDTHIVYAEKDLNVDAEFTCNTPDLGEPPSEALLQTPEELPGNCIRIYVEVDFDIFQNKGSVTNTANYITAVFNQSATLFANDGIPVSLSEMLIWNVQSPYAGLTTTNALLGRFQQTRTSFNGDFGHLLALRGNGGLAATINGFCSSAATRECFSGIHTTFSNVPTYSWTVEVFTHELGHLMGSFHTHACVWNGNNTAIDGCGPAVGAVEGSCSAGPIPSNGGTIMSYCHLTSAGINFTLGFGTQPRNAIINRLNNATCLTNCGGPPNDNFGNAQIITNSSGAASGTNIGATKESGEPNHAGIAGGKSVWYRWQAPGSGTATITTGANYDSLLAVYTGTPVNALTHVASNDDDPNGGVSSRVTFTTTAGTIYSIAVDGFNAASGSINLNWSLAGGPPAAPVAQPATNVTTTSFTANWSSSTGATGYRLDVSTTNTFSSFVPGFQNLDVGNVLSRSVTGLTPGTTYFYRVRAYNNFATSGNSGTIQATTNTGTIQVTVQTNLAGRSFTVDGVQFTSAQTFNWTPGSAHTISTTSPQASSVGVRYAWINWSDGGAISHSVSPTSNTTYTANFQLQYLLTMNPEPGGIATPASNWFNSGQSVNISATPNTGFNFGGWIGSGSTGSFSGFNNPATVIMDGPITQKARFAQGPAAVYDATLKAPKCGQPGSVCDSGTLLNGRGTIQSGAEVNQPNTINNSCVDGTTGTYHVDESIDSVRVSTLDGTPFAPGKTVRIDVAVWVFNISIDFLDLFYAADANNPNWVHIATLQASAPRAQLLSATYTLPNGSASQAVRARWRDAGTLSPCSGPSTFDDHDDLIFTTVNAVNVALPANGGVASASSTYSTAYPASNAINGERAGANSTTGGVFNGWLGSTATMPQWLQVDFGQVRNIQEIDVFTLQDNYQNPSPPTQDMTFSLYGLQGYEVQYWNGSAWLAITGATVTGNNKVWKQFTFPTVATSRIRVLTSASPDSYSRITEIEAWSNNSTPPPPSAVNVALPANGGVASASSTYSTAYPASNAINGERAGANSTTGGVLNGWIGSTATMPQWVQVDFGQVRNIHEVDVFTVQDNYPNPAPPTQDMTFSLYGLQGYEVQYWNGSAWVAVPGGTVSGNNKVWKQFTFPAIATSRIRVLTSASPDSYSRVTEIEAWANAAPPPQINVALPANGGVASASSTYSTAYPASNAINGERAGANSTTGGVFNGWLGSTATMPQWVQVDFGQVRNIHEIDVFTLQDNYPNPSPPTQDMTFSLYGLQGYEVQYWNGSAWVAIPGGTVSGNNKVWKQFTFTAIATSRIRVLTSASPDSYSRVTEVEAWSSP